MRLKTFLFAMTCMTTSAFAEVVVDRTLPEKGWTYSKEAFVTPVPEKEAHPCAGKADCNLVCRIVEHPHHTGKSWQINVKPCRDCSTIHARFDVEADKRSKWVCGPPGFFACVEWYNEAGRLKSKKWQFEGVVAATLPSRQVRYVSERPRYRVSHVERRRCTQCNSSFHQRFHRHFTCCK
mgnify:FL=1